MSNPNIVSVATITGKTTATTLTASYTTQIENTAASGKIYKVNTVMVSNTNTSAVNVSLDFYRGTTSISLASAVAVPAGSSIVLVSKDTSIYLEEGDAMRALGNEANYLNLVASYEEIS